MSTTIQATCGLICGNDGITPTTISVAQTNAHHISNIQNIGTSAVQLSFGSVTSIGYVALKNLDPTNYVDISLTNPPGAESFARLQPNGIPIVITTIQTAIYAKAHTAACDVQVVAVEL